MQSFLRRKIGSYKLPINTRKRRNASRSYIATGGILTAAEGLQHAQQADQVYEEVVEQSDPWPAKQAPPKCSGCGILGHTIRQCSNH